MTTNQYYALTEAQMNALQSAIQKAQTDAANAHAEIEQLWNVTPVIAGALVLTWIVLLARAKRGAE